MKPRIMYMENKDARTARIGLCTFSRTGKRIYYKDQCFQRTGGQGIRGNHVDVRTGEEYWISGPKKNGLDRLYEMPAVEIDEDIREQYWLEIRQLPEFREVVQIL